MGEYANIKRKNINSLLKWLCKKDGSISIEAGGNHNIKLKYSFWKRPFPVPFKNGEINKHIIKDLSKKLIKSQICTKEEFDKKIK